MMDMLVLGTQSITVQSKNISQGLHESILNIFLRSHNFVIYDFSDTMLDLT